MTEVHKLRVRIVSAYLLLLALFSFFVRAGWQEKSIALLTPFFEPLRVSAQSLSMVSEHLMLNLSLPWQQAQEIQELKVRYALLLAQQQEMTHLRKENESLKKMLAMPVNSDKEQRIASVYSYTFPAVASGKNAGVTEGMSVLADGVLVGTISEVREATARVELLQSRSSDDAILAQTEMGVLGIMISKWGRLVLTHIPLSAQIREGDTVFTVGQDGVAPRKVLGVIQSIKDNPHAGIREAEIVQPSSFFSTAIVTLE